MINFKQDYILENKVTLLRPLIADDIKYFRPFSKYEPELWEYFMVSAAGEENLKKFFKLELNLRTVKAGYPFILFDKRTNEYAGGTSFYDFSALHQTASVGSSWCGKKFQGTGLNKNCKYLLLAFLFDKVGLERVEFRTDKNNTKSIAALKSIGSQIEGTLRNNYKRSSGKRSSSVVLSIIKEDWERETKTMLLKKLIQLPLNKTQ